MDERAPAPRGARNDALPSATARRFAALGFSVIPVPRPRPRAGDDAGGKVPAISWAAYQTQRATDAELVAWFAGVDMNVAIVTGAVSDIVVIDADDPHAIRYCTRHLPYTPWQTWPRRPRARARPISSPPNRATSFQMVWRERAADRPPVRPRPPGRADGDLHRRARQPGPGARRRDGRAAGHRAGGQHHPRRDGRARGAQQCRADRRDQPAEPDRPGAAPARAGSTS